MFRVRGSFPFSIAITIAIVAVVGLTLVGCQPTISAPAESSITLSPTDNLVLVPLNELPSTAVTSDTFVLAPVTAVTTTLILTETMATFPSGTVVLATIDALVEMPTDTLALVSNETPGLVLTNTFDLVPSSPLTVTASDPAVLVSTTSITPTTATTDTVLAVPLSEVQASTEALIAPQAFTPERSRSGGGGGGGDRPTLPSPLHFQAMGGGVPGDYCIYLGCPVWCPCR